MSDPHLFKNQNGMGHFQMDENFWTRQRGIALVSLLTGLALLVSACRGFGGSKSNPDSIDLVKVAVRDEGICQIGLLELGWGLVNPDYLQVYNREVQVPVWITGEGGDTKIHFYCQPGNSRYTPENIYLILLGSDAGLKITESDSITLEGLPSVEQVTSTIHFEQNEIYSPVARDGENWFWEKITAPQHLSLEVDLVDVAGGDGAIKAMLWGSTFASSQPDHHAILWVNGQMVADRTWEGQTRYAIVAQVPEGVLKEGVNIIEIELPEDTGRLVDITYLDWIKVSYNRLPRLVDGSLIFSTQGGLVELSNYRGQAHVFDITDKAAVSVFTLMENQPFHSDPDRMYLTADSSGLIKPADIKPAATHPDLRDPQNSAEYLMIGLEDLLEAATPLLELRDSQGLSVMAVPVSVIYDQFNAGMAEPVAIQKFLTHVVENWITPPVYVLLVGDASYDFKGYAHPEGANRFPVMMIHTAYGSETASDVLLADINEDPWPDLAIGRIPARTPEQVAVYVEKVLSYESTSSGDITLVDDWRNRVLAVADRHETRFKDDAISFLELFPPGYQVKLIAPQVEDESAHQEVVDEIERGYWLTAYFGHGSLTTWGKDRLFTIDDSIGLSNQDRLTIMIHLTCLTGLFTHPTQESLTESLLFQPQGGAVAVLAPTSLTLPDAQVGLAEGFTEALLASPDGRLGDAALYAWRQVSVDSVESEDVMKTFLLFGDPALNPHVQAP